MACRPPYRRVSEDPPTYLRCPRCATAFDGRKRSCPSCGADNLLSSLARVWCAVYGAESAVGRCAREALSHR
jgi:RNA polymerase subunit RPABC4/transcription elongation factor Spt4